MILQAIVTHVGTTVPAPGHDGRVDLAMFPVIPNIGGDFALGARLYLQAVKTHVFIPMHTWGRNREATQFHLYQSPYSTTYQALLAGEEFTA